MNSTPTTKCGYAGSDMVGILKKDSSGSCTAETETEPGLGKEGSTLHDIYENYIQPDFTDAHVLTYQNLLTNKTDETATNNRMGNTSLKGASSDWKWYPRKLDLMSEMNVYGGIVASSSVYDTGIDNRQYALFRLKPELMYSYDGKQIGHYWLKDVASKDRFALVGGDGGSGASAASGSYGVRPRFLIG